MFQISHSSILSLLHSLLVCLFGYIIYSVMLRFPNLSAYSVFFFCVGFLKATSLRLSTHASFIPPLLHASSGISPKVIILLLAFVLWNSVKSFFMLLFW